MATTIRMEILADNPEELLDLFHRLSAGAPQIIPTKKSRAPVTEVPEPSEPSEIVDNEPEPQPEPSVPTDRGEDRGAKSEKFPSLPNVTKKTKSASAKKSKADAETEAAPKGNGVEALDLAAIRDEVTSILQSAFAKGRVKEVRQILSDHGGGVKSFAEVELERFPAMREAMKTAGLV